MDFCHLHCHTQYSLLDGHSDIGVMMDKVVADGQKGIALTDHGNMFGAFKFVAEAEKRNIKPIVGCEFYLVKDRHKKSFSRANNERDVRFHQLLLAKNRKGYENLSKLCSLGYMEGLYSKFPRIDKELLVQYSEGLIATSCCLGAEIPQTILRKGVEQAEDLLKWWLDLFGDDFYIELQRHRGLENIDDLGMSQEDINQVLIGFAKKYNIKLIATNDAHYVEEDDWQPHDILLCVNTNSKVEESKRFKFPSSDFYVKTKDEMSFLFADVPEAVDNTMEIFDKIEKLNLKRDVLLPNFPLPAGFKNQPEFLKHIVYQGAKRRYGELNELTRDRLDLELNIIKNMGFDGYFLIVQDFIDAARKMGVSVGPGRGSAAGSAVAYSLAITNIDPIKYNLLFERFLNPERISMPDIDIDFDDIGRQKVIDWVVDKYGREQVAQIVTFGTMAARSSIRDVGRVLDVPLSSTDVIAKLVPSKPGTKLKKLFGLTDKEIAKDWKAEDFTNIKKLYEYEARTDLEGKTVQLAQRLEGSVRNTGIHAAGVIIAPDVITKFIPVCTSKESDLLITQFDGDVVESAGMLKMDFLGLKTLSIIKDAIEIIVLRHGEEARFDIDEIPLDDDLTFKLFQRGEMVGVFQFESEGMRKHLRSLKPTDIEDLIAMNALYRPGPMDYIPSFIARKHGIEPIEYPHEWLEDILKPTNGIMVYQEQIMQTAQIMADYSLGKADMLRRAMGKKKVKEMERHQKIFVEGATAKGVDQKQAEGIFETMAKFASYGFNRSHAAAYSVVAYQTGYLKAHYPAEYMASVLSHNKNDITKLNFFLRECKRMEIKVLSPCINESQLNFSVNKEGDIRFGLSALKGVGEGPVEAILEARKSGEGFTSIYDFVRRVNLRAVNKTCLTGLAYGGGFDSTNDFHRAQYLAPVGKYATFIEQLIRYGNYCQEEENKTQGNLFGGSGEEEIPEPPAPICEEWTLLQKLMNEKDVAGIFLSGHPLDVHQATLDQITNVTLDKIETMVEREIKIAAFVTKSNHRISKKGTGWGLFTIQDYNGQLEFPLFGEKYQDFKGRLEEGQIVYIEGSYEKRWKSEEYQFQVKNVRQLDTVKEKLINGVILSMPIEDLTQDILADIKKLCEQNKGKHVLKWILHDDKNKLNLYLRSDNKKINADEAFFNGLRKLGIRYSLN